ncbi:MAG TPA: outer membrane beta-barrel protein [Flavisolibacter sp.]|nr:outer membrane beta-barrel protein [Flavisolibacter sp.]
MKMRSVYVGAALLLSSFLSASAQSGGQLRAGVNLANVSVTKDGHVDDAKMLTSFQVGFIGDFPLAGNLLSLQPGILFSGKGSKTEAGNAEGTYYSKATSNPFYIEVPVSLVAKLPLGGGSRFFVGGGAYGAIGVAGKTKIETKLGPTFQKYEESINFSNDDPSTLEYEEGAGFGILKRFDYGLNGTAGIEGKSVVLGINYGLGLAKLQSGSANEDNNNKHRVLSITLGFKL